MKRFNAAFVCFILALSLCACGTSTSSTVPSSSLPESSESTPPQVSSLVVESESEPEVDPIEETNTLLQSGVWSTDINEDSGESWVVYRFEGDTCNISACGYGAMGGVTRYCSYTITDETVTVSWDAATEGTYIYNAGSETLLISSDGTTLSGDGNPLQKKAFPTEGVDYFGDSMSDWKRAQAEMGLRIRTAPNTDAEIVSETRNGMSVISVIGISQIDPAWYFVLYGSQVGYAHSDYITM